jgi:hypothetical protein
MKQAEEDDPANDDYMGQADSISIKTSVPNYEDMLGKLTKVINTGLDCLGLGGTRKRRYRKMRNRRSRRWVGW